MKTYLFYDIETSGLHPSFDQVLTFACIRTDLRLNELDRQSITIQLRNDIIPSPRAFLTHGLTFDELQAGLCEYDAALKIHKIVNTPGTISLGYNSLGFDDEFLRFLFYRNLLDPYTHQYGQGCSRMDILPVTVIYRLFSQCDLIWPEIEGKATLKLEHISRENKFVTSGRAHEAMSDVEATVALSKVFFQEQDIWRYASDFFNKTKDEIRINNMLQEFIVKNKSFRICLMVSASFGADNNYLAPVVHLGPSKAYKNQSLWLRLDNEDILGVESDKAVSEIMVIRKRAADAYIVLPCLERFWVRLTDKAKDNYKKNIQTIQDRWSIFFELIQFHGDFKYPYIPDMDIDGSLYQEGFFTKKEKMECQRFHSEASDQKQKVLEEMTSLRVKNLATRILFRNFEYKYLPTVQSAARDYIGRLKSAEHEDLFVGYKNDSKMTFDEAKKELEKAKSEMPDLTSLQKEMIQCLEIYFSEL